MVWDIIVNRNLDVQDQLFITIHWAQDQQSSFFGLLKKISLDIMPLRLFVII